MRDLEFLSGNFFDMEIPKDKRYLLKYFEGDLQTAFLRYYLVFGNVSNFVDHTGMYCHERTKWKMRTKLLYLTRTYEAAKKSLTEEGMALVQLIELGKHKLKKIRNS
jgi:hypothetical protein